MAKSKVAQSESDANLVPISSGCGRANCICRPGWLQVSSNVRSANGFRFGHFVCVRMLWRSLGRRNFYSEIRGALFSSATRRQREIYKYGTRLHNIVLDCLLPSLCSVGHATNTRKVDYHRNSS